MRITRELATNIKEPIILYIEKPHRTRESEYGCKIGIEGDGLNICSTIYGIDAIQALILAVAHLDNFVRNASKSLYPKYIVWDAGGHEGDYGLLVT